MKRIVILCDGTWNRSDSTTPTNVVRFAQAMRLVDAAGIVQIPIYFQGVGTGRGPTPGLRRIDSLLGGAFGLGLMSNLIEAYRHLVFLYEPGDEIFVLGFSRGAYTARSLTGFIRSTGIIDRDALHYIPKAIERYRTMGDPTTHPSTDDSHAFRAELSTRVVTSEAEQSWRREAGLSEAPILRIHYLGVWDSVGALGVPVSIPLLGRWTAQKYRFHDANLSSMVQSARHAVAIDERRRSFAPTRWENIDQLNETAEAGQVAPYLEQFFAGDHGSVGGGGDISELSSIGLSWIIEGAQDAGLGFEEEALQQFAREQDPMGPLRNTKAAPSGLMNRIMRLRPLDRVGPSSPKDLHSSDLQRWAAEVKSEGFEPYRPASLEGVPAPAVRRRTGFHGNNASRVLRNESQQLSSGKLLSKDNRPVVTRPV